MIKIGEDADLLSRIIINKEKLGVVHDAEYLYRIRLEGTSAIQGAHFNKDWYTNSILHFSLQLIDYSRKQCGYIPYYIQFVVMYDLKWRFNSEVIDKVLTYEEKQEFIDKLREVLNYIDDEIILNQVDLNIHKRMYALQIKYGEYYSQLIKHIVTKDDIYLYFKNYQLDSIKNQKIIISLIEASNNTLTIEGSFGSLFNREDIDICVKVDNEFYPIDLADLPSHSIYSLGNPIKEYNRFSFNFPINEDLLISSLEFYICRDNISIPVDLTFKRFGKINEKYKNSYYAFRCNNYRYMVYMEEKSIKVARASIREIMVREASYLKEIYKTGGIGANKAVVARLTTAFFGSIKRKPIWLFMDKKERADDNAEHLFKYAVKQKDRINKYFVIDSNSKDYARLKKIGKVLKYGSYKHKVLTLLADKIISSHTEEHISNPFLDMEIYYRDKMRSDFIFLQHGITKDDISRYVNKYNKNIKIFITAAKPEYKSILNGNYGYDENVVKLTGFPRFDGLDDNRKKQILIAPTWRMSIVLPKDQKTGRRPYNKAFKKSEFFQNFNRLINDVKIINAAKEYGYSIVFLPHPEIMQQVDDFEKNDYVRLLCNIPSYQKLFKESSLLITDFSSIAFDFAYLKKPVIYFQFDENHYDKGYFDYETMGFGEVCRDYQKLRDTLISYIQTECQMKKEYIDRLVDFYGYMDRNNCERTYKEILNN